MKNKKIINVLYALNAAVIVALVVAFEKFFKMQKSNLAFTMFLINLFFIATFFILHVLKSKYQRK